MLTSKEELYQEIEKTGKEEYCVSQKWNAYITQKFWQKSKMFLPQRIYKTTNKLVNKFFTVELKMRPINLVYATNPKEFFNAISERPE